MTITTSRNGRKIRFALAALSAATVLAGCANTNAATGLVSDVGPTHVACTNSLELNFADNGGTRCVRRGGDVFVNLFGPDGTYYPGVERSGSLLGPSLASVPVGNVAFRARSRGTTVITSANPTCSPFDTTASCSPGTPWSVTVIVK